jgi:hypothetical protein
MKQLSLSAPFSLQMLRVAVCALLAAGATSNLFARENGSSHSKGTIFAATAADGGRLVIRRSPTLGDNVSVTLRLDGKLAGTLTRGRTYDQFIAPGDHTIAASPSAGGIPWRGTVNVHAGETYTYTATYTVNQIALTPAANSR